MFKKEPAVIISVLVALFQAGWMFFGNSVEVDSDWLRPLATVLAGFLIRAKVFSEATIREAGFTPDQIMDRAHDPAIPAATEE